MLAAGVVHGGTTGEVLTQRIEKGQLSDRPFEAGGRVRRAVSVIKKRTGPHEDTIRELRITDRGILLGEPLEDFQGVLRGVPTYTGPSKPLLHD